MCDESVNFSTLTSRVLKVARLMLLVAISSIPCHMTSSISAVNGLCCRYAIVSSMFFPLIAELRLHWFGVSIAYIFLHF